MKTVLVVGASRGIGAEFAATFLAEGWNVYATTRDGKPSPALTKALAIADSRAGATANSKAGAAADLGTGAYFRTGANADKNVAAAASEDSNPFLKILPLDLTKETSIADLKKHITGPLDLVVNNAGVMTDSRQGLFETPATTFLESFKVNSIAPLFVFQAVREKLAKAESPVFVSLTSQMGSISDNTSGGYYAYRMSKAALNMGNKSLSLDFPEITFVVMHPGWVKTEMGGPQAPLSTKDSVDGMLKVIKRLKKLDSGKFLNYKGDTIAW